MKPTSQHAVDVRNFSLAIGGTTILRDITLQCPAHRISVIIGRSGSGKSTFLRSINRLNDTILTCTHSGTIRLHLDQQWVDIHDPGVRVEKLRHQVGMVFQSPNVLPMSIRKNMTLPLKIVAGHDREQRFMRMEQALREARLWEEVKDRLDKPATILSGGQQQRLCLARALALEPEILLLDEPTSSLDHKAARGIEELILGLRDRYSLMVVSHSLRQTRRIGDLITVFREGGMQALFSRQEFLEQDMSQVMEEWF
ncbi:phosphate ABC transporter ATP-binding protein [Desulfoplanes formicivorans]|uniref:Phosphate ABC transporter ATP-binding protein n=1 Tax=Desulfoplanes formicivorans TaxID=1592317 RepID=A0A194AKM6_9BACT|nr:ATP-binding cassette domain-containing protein [Desulfoplanes formicivorans]GAU09868.1 phosphate ABC transporter ATP-binding protein [Desulfoplanes formicivorans]